MATQGSQPDEAREGAGEYGGNVLDWSKFVKVANGGYQRLEDYCNVGPKGAELLYTTVIMWADEELFGIENGWRVLNYAMEYNVDGWDALMDLRYQADHNG